MFHTGVHIHTHPYVHVYLKVSGTTPFLLLASFIWLHQVLVVTCGIFNCVMQTLSWGTWDLIS